MGACDLRYGFRILGPTSGPRRLVDAGAAFAAYATCDQRAECHKESYLSAFWFGDDFRRLLTDTGSTAGFAGPCWSPWLWWDLDNEDLHFAHKDAAALAVFLVERYTVAPGDLLIFFSGSKGFHLGLPTALWSPAPSDVFHRIARRFAERLAELAAVTIDTGIYDKVRAFRAPNSRHPKTGLHKGRLTLDELTGLSLDRILERAKGPAPFAVPTPAGTSDQAAADWQAAVDQVRQESEAKAALRAAGNGAPTLNRATLDFIRSGADQGDRHRLLFSAAANLAEFGCPPALAHALLTESALDSGLPPKEVRRQIECGLAAVRKGDGAGSTLQDCAGSPQDPLDDQNVKNTPERDRSDSRGSERQCCQRMTGATDSTPADLKAALAKLWGEGGKMKAEGGRPQSEIPNPKSLLPPDPPPLRPLPPRTVATGTMERACRCGCWEYAEVAITGGRTRRDCRGCGRFIAWGKWYDQGEATP